jgi:hypothetical protein
MWYKIDFKRFGIILLPTFLRKQVIVGYVHALLTPIDNLYYKWTNFRNDNIYKLEHTGQVCSLRGSLNDKFDPVERRIYITDGNRYETTYIYTEGEAQDVFVSNESEVPTIWLRTEAETADTGLDFIVWVPESIFNTQIYGLKAHVEFYKAGGFRYNIFIDE